MTAPADEAIGILYCVAYHCKLWPLDGELQIGLESFLEKARIMLDVNALGYVAGTLTTVSFAPQAWRAWKTRSMGDVSLWTFVLFVLGIALWLVYGVALESWPLIAANAVSLVLALFILVMKLLHR